MATFVSKYGEEQRQKLRLKRFAEENRTKTAETNLNRYSKLEKFRDTYEKCNEILAAASGYALLNAPDMTRYSVNTNGVLTELIKTTGRLCENYASDLFIDWQELVEPLINHISLKDDEDILIFGIRKNGVDNSTSYLDNETNNYRAILALDVKRGIHNNQATIELVLKDLSYDIPTI